MKKHGNESRDDKSKDSKKDQSLTDSKSTSTSKSDMGKTGRKPGSKESELGEDEGKGSK